jgi:protein-S-isoprenylcysteine O-methyltransferase Ste14
MIANAAEPNNKLRYALDGAERVLVTALFLFLLYRFASALHEHPTNGIYLVTEGIVMLLVVLRRSTDQISLSPRDWFIAFAGTTLSMAVLPGTAIEPLSTLSGIFLIVGFLISLAAKLQLRRSFGLVAANRGIKTRGVYGLVRHPMYLGYFFVQAGMLMLNFSVWNILVLGSWAILQIMRINAEEKVLMADAGYRAHAERVRFRLFPGFY